MKLEDKNVTEWKPNNTQCLRCQLIDQLCNQYYNIIETNQTNEILREDIISQLNMVEVNGYKLLKVLESSGYIINDITKIDDVSNYVIGKNYSEELKNVLYNMNNNIRLDINLLSSRWCSYCGHRKPDMIE